MNWEVVESRFDQKSGTVFLEIRETARLWESVRGPKDTSVATCYDHTEALTWRHLNIFQHRCEITCRLPRGKCRQCGHVFRVRPPWEGLSTHFTKEVEAFALLLMREMPMSKLAALVGETDTRLWRMLFRQVDAAYAEADFSSVCCVVVDEMSVRKGHEYIRVFADLVRKRVLVAAEGKDKATWVKFLEAFEQHNGHRHSITQASMDMSQAYQSGATENCRNVQVVFAKFHVIQNAHQAVDKVRRAEVRLGGRGVWESLHKSQWLWRKNPENLTELEQERLARIQDKNLGTAKAYQMRLVLQDIYRSASAVIAKRRFAVWCRWVRWVARFYKAKGNLPGCDGEAGANDRKPFGGDPGSREVGSDQRVPGRIKQRLPRDQTQGSRLPFDDASDHPALLRRRKTPLPPILIPPKTAKNHGKRLFQFRLKGLGRSKIELAESQPVLYDDSVNAENAAIRKGHL
ncbi:MAG: ISL3 family transposase [Verrucomicrobia bacterium]|nr:ISL3 family transposase [Verrucomicrobiota bacterium]